jgi:hypothetical protein
MQVKAQGLLNAGKYIEATYGREGLDVVLRDVSRATRDTYESAIAINWHPVDELCDFVDHAERRFGNGTWDVAQGIGAAGARANLKGVMLRIALYLTKPSFLMTRIAGMWRQFNDEGQMTLVEMTTERAIIEVSGIAKPRATFCHVLTGWVGEVTQALGAEIDSLQHTHCRARGGTRCVWEVRGRVKVD